MALYQAAPLHQAEDSEAEQQILIWGNSRVYWEEHMWDVLWGLCIRRKRGFMQLSAHTYQEATPLAPCCQERDNLGAPEPSCLPYCVLCS